jgi:hypothetical protein
MRHHPKPQTRMNNEPAARQPDLRTSAPSCLVWSNREP